MPSRKLIFLGFGRNGKAVILAASFPFWCLCMSSDAPETAARPLIRNLRLGLLTVAWGAALVTILSGQAHGMTATCGAAALGLFILLTLPRLQRDSLIILAMLGVAMLVILDDVGHLSSLEAPQAVTGALQQLFDAL